MRNTPSLPSVTQGAPSLVSQYLGTTWGHGLWPCTSASLEHSWCSINICQTELNFARDKMCVSSAICSQTEPRDIFTPHISLVKCCF